VIVLLSTTYLVRAKLKTNGFKEGYNGNQEVRYQRSIKMKDGKTYHFNTCPCGIADVLERKKREVKLDDLGDLKVSGYRGFNARRFQRRQEMNGKLFETSEVVVNGLSAASGSIPWQVHIEDMNNANICGGAVLNLFYILSAAHCTTSFRKSTGSKTFPNNILVLIRNPKQCDPSVPLAPFFTRTITEVHDHPRYGKKRDRAGKEQVIYDFTILRTDKPMIPFTSALKPVCLPPIEYWTRRKRIPTGTKVKFSGYGRTERESIKNKDQTSCKLLYNWGRILKPTNPRCARVSSFPKVQICAAGHHNDATSDTCSGDSGSPLTGNLNKDPYTQFLIGVVSYGTSYCGREDASGVYSRVSSVLPWIVKIVKDGECKSFQMYNADIFKDYK